MTGSEYMNEDLEDNRKAEVGAISIRSIENEADEEEAFELKRVCWHGTKTLQILSKASPCALGGCLQHSYFLLSSMCACRSVASPSRLSTFIFFCIPITVQRSSATRDDF